MNLKLVQRKRNKQEPENESVKRLRELCETKSFDEIILKGSIKRIKLYHLDICQTDCSGMGLCDLPFYESEAGAKWVTVSWSYTRNPPPPRPRFASCNFCWYRFNRDPKDALCANCSHTMFQSLHWTLPRDLIFIVLDFFRR